MAKLFSGMSQTNFLDGLVARTGKNGHELYDYLVSLIPKEETVEREEVVRECVAPSIFIGTKQEFLDWAQMYMREDDYQLLNKWKNSMAHGYFACCVAKSLGYADGGFTWVYTAHTMGGNPINIEYYIYKTNTGVLDWSEKIFEEKGSTV